MQRLMLRRDGILRILIYHTSTYSTWNKINYIDFAKAYTIKIIQHKELFNNLQYKNQTDEKAIHKYSSFVSYVFVDIHCS